MLEQRLSWVKASAHHAMPRMLRGPTMEMAARDGLLSLDWVTRHEIFNTWMTDVRKRRLAHAIAEIMSPDTLLQGRASGFSLPELVHVVAKDKQKPYGKQLTLDLFFKKRKQKHMPKERLQKPLLKQLTIEHFFTRAIQ